MTEDSSSARVLERFLDGEALAVELVRSWIRVVTARYPAALGEDRDDLEQDILLYLTTTGRDLDRRPNSLRSYVQRAVHNKCIDRIRANRRRTWVPVSSLQLEDEALAGDELLVQREERLAILGIFDQAPESCRKLWRMIEMGMGYREMSEELGVSEGALRVRVMRCRRRAMALRSGPLED